MTPPRRAKLVLLVLAVAIVGLGVWAREPVYWWVMTERVWSEHETDRWVYVRGWERVSRWADDSPNRHRFEGKWWYVRNGLLYYHHDAQRRTTQTFWDINGSVQCQLQGSELRRSPPWLWGVTAQTKPTMPAWMKDDEKWAKALEEAR